jgi:hypothetical protein
MVKYNCIQAIIDGDGRKFMGTFDGQAFDQKTTI